MDQTRRAAFAGEQAAGDVVRRIFATVGTQPACNRIHVYTERTQDVFGHCFLPNLLRALAIGLAPWVRADPIPLRQTMSDGCPARISIKYRLLLVNSMHESSSKKIAAESVKRTTLSEAAHQAIRRNIITGVLAPGSK